MSSTRSSNTTRPTEPTPPAPGSVVFFDAAVFGEPDPATFAGIVITAGRGRVRVITLGRLDHAADFTPGDIRENA